MYQLGLHPLNQERHQQRIEHFPMQPEVAQEHLPRPHYK